MKLWFMRKYIALLFRISYALNRYGTKASERALEYDFYYPDPHRKERMLAWLDELKNQQENKNEH